MIHIGLRNQKNSPTEVLEYIKRKETIPIQLFLKYYKKYACIHNVKIKCVLCGKEEIVCWDTLNNRMELYNDIICCKKCSYIYSTCIRGNIPKEIIPYYFNDKYVPYSLYLKYREYNANKLKVECNCEVCNKKTYIYWSTLKNRQHSCNKQICYKCIRKYTSNLNIVKDRNSKAQLIAQNKPESKEKQRIAQIKRCKENPESIEKQKIGIKKFFQTEKGLKLKEKIAKNAKHPRCLTGIYNNIKFDSSWELSILIYFENQNISRSNLKIPYIMNNTKHLYFPDFILNDNILLEVKGEKTNIVNIKKEAAINYIADNNLNLEYKLMYYKDLKKLPGFIFYNTLDKINRIDKTKLEITNYPKSWNINL